MQNVRRGPTLPGEEQNDEYGAIPGFGQVY